MTITLPYGTFAVHHGDGWVNAQTEKEGFWDLDLKPYFDQVPPGALVIDVGAHVGFYSVYLASKGHPVIAVEGHPIYLPLLAQNVGEWPVWIEPHFAYSRSCRLQEQRVHQTPASNTWVPAETGAVAEPLDGLRALLHDQTLGLLKVDAQGADLQVLLGAEQIIAAHHPPILLEFEVELAAQHGHTWVDYVRWAAEHGYGMTALSDQNRSLVWEGR